DFNSPEAMTIRFEQLLKIRDAEVPFTINDYGCAYGALYEWMSRRGMVFHYRGFDVCGEMILEGRRLHGAKKNCEFVVRECDLSEADYTVAGGIFNLRFGRTDPDCLVSLLDTLSRVAALSRRGFAFNALTKYSHTERMRQDLYYADPTFLFDYCKRNFS